MQIERPRLVQRCILTKDMLEYDITPNAYFEVGGQGESLRRIFSRKIETAELNVHVGGKNVTVYMLAGKGFDFAMYQQYLQQMAEGKIRLEEQPRMYEAIRMLLKLEVFMPTPVNTWFDFTNDVLWSISEDNHKKLLERLELIEKAWAVQQ